MNKLPIFKGLPDITAEVAMQLVPYWRKAGGDAMCIIDKLGHLHYGDKFQDIWRRPCSAQNFKALKEAFAGCKHPAVRVEDEQITFNFGLLQYNQDFVKELIVKYKMGVCDSDRGLMYYRPTPINGEIRYVEEQYRFRRVTVASLGLDVSRICPISAISVNMHELQEHQNPECQTLYFPAAA